MSTPQHLLQAAVNRLAARLGSGLADTAAGMAVLAQDAPARIQQELGLFWEEVEREADRLEGRTADDGKAAAWTGSHPSSAGNAKGQPQAQIDALRARVAELSRRLDQRPQGRAE
jgi:uncharacterized protein YceH (UPF0502 family)